MLRIRSPFVAATAGGMLALAGDKLWLIYDTLLKPQNDLIPHGVVYGTIFASFLIGMAMMGWAVVMFRRNGYAHFEVRDELEFRRGERRRRRFAQFLRRSRALESQAP